MRALGNSVWVAGWTTVLAITIGSFCAYALARLRFKGKFFILGLVLAITTFPGIAIAAPLFKLWSNIGLFDTLTGLIIPDLTFALPLAIFILVSFFKEIPKDLEEAALVDGATYFQAFRKVVVPLAAPGMATAAILVFIGAWNEFLFAITLTSTPQARTVPAAIAFFTGRDDVRDPDRHDHRGVRGDLHPADRHGAPLPEAHRGRPHRGSREGMMSFRRRRACGGGSRGTKRCCQDYKWRPGSSAGAAEEVE